VQVPGHRVDQRLHELVHDRQRKGVQAASHKAEEGVSLVLAGDRRQRGEAPSGRRVAGQGFIRHAPDQGRHPPTTDMAGGALMIAVMSALQELGVPVTFTGPVVAAENMPSSSAMAGRSQAPLYGWRRGRVACPKRGGPPRLSAPDRVAHPPSRASRPIPRQANGLTAAHETVNTWAADATAQPSGQAGHA
jgi:hypothetical protein